MKHYYRYITDRYLFRIVTSLLLAGAVTVSIIYKDLLWIVISSLLLLTSLRWQWKLYRRHTQKVLFLLDPFLRTRRYSGQPYCKPGPEPCCFYII